MPHTGTAQQPQDFGHGGLVTLNTLERDEFVTLILDTCHLPLPTWSEQLEAARPFDDVPSLIAAAQSLVRGLADDEVARAHAGLTPLGTPRVTSTDRQARWSRIESAGIPRDQATLDALSEANRLYQEKFGHVFLISAAGLEASEMLEAMSRRTRNDRATEYEIVRGELCKLVALRLERLVGEMN
jgi:2-oxo-4-hydroxy-4-carboxy-5-ureidoimidazoline decarboxylase